MKIPSHKPEDKLFNRRLMAYAGLVFSLVWFQQVIILVFVGYFFEVQLSAAVVIALLGVPTTLAGLGFWQYLKAAGKT